jgi:hypothetical protein
MVYKHIPYSSRAGTCQHKTIQKAGGALDSNCFGAEGRLALILNCS